VTTNAQEVLVLDPDGNRTLRAHIFKIEENIKMKFKDKDLKIVNLVRLVHAEASGGLM
jgi:hypothetical protein